MKKVVTINLNGNAYQIDEDGYSLIDDYLLNASATLTGNPDIAEILSDLEQALADKCVRFLRRDKNVVTAGEVREILKEMGPVDAGFQTGGMADEAKHAESGGREPASGPREPRRLYRLEDEGMFKGVCAGIGAYLGVDPTVVRAIGVVLLVVSGGAVAGVYALLLVFMPEARTPEEKAAAYGAPFNAQEVLNQAKNKFDDMTSGPGGEKWRRHWRSQQRYWRSRTGDFGDFMPFLLLFFGVFFGVNLIVNITRGVFVPNMMGVWRPWIGGWFPVILILAGVVIVFAGRRDAGLVRGVLATMLSLVAVLVFLWFAFTTIPVFQSWVGEFVAWWCQTGLWGC